MNIKRFLSLVLSLTMLFSIIVLPGNALSDDEVIEEIITEIPAVEETAAEESAPAEAPEVEEPKVEEAPVAEEPEAEEPKAEEEPAAEEVVINEPVAEELVVEEPVAEEPVAEEPVAEEPVAEEPVVEEPVAEEPVAEEPVAEEPVAEEPVVEEPVADEPTIEEPVVEEPAVEEPVEEAFKAGLVYITEGDVFEDEKLKEKAGTIEKEAIVFATARVTGEGELAKGDIIRIAANVDGQIKTLYVKYARLSFLTDDQTAAYAKAKHEDGIEYRDTYLDPVEFTAVVAEIAAEEEPAEVSEPEEAPAEVIEEIAEAAEVIEDTALDVVPEEEKAPEQPVVETKSVEDLEIAIEETETVADAEVADAVAEEEAANEEPEVEILPETEAVLEEEPETEAIWEAVITLKSQRTIAIRKTAAASGDEAFKADNGEQVTVLFVQGNWAYISTDKGEGYIMLKFLEKAETKTDAEETIEGIIEIEETEETAVTETTDAVIEEEIEEVANIDETEDVIEVESAEAQTGIVITTQPTSKVAAVGEKVTFSVVATGNGLTYQWQYKNKTATTWTNASGKTANWVLTVANVHLGFDFQCVITDASGNKATTKTVNIIDKNGPPVITEQPTSKVAAVGEKVTLSVVALGNGLTYQWQYKNKTATTWTNASGKTANWVLTVANVHFGFDFHCVITDANGNKVTTETVNVNDKNAPPVITKQPTSQVAAVGEKVTLSVVALGNGLTYQWQYKNKAATDWTNASGKTANWQLTVANVHFGFDFQCVITDANGKKVTTDIVNIANKNGPPVITKQPTSQVAAVGEKVTLSVVALGNGLTYQWQYKNKTATTWTNASGKTANWQLKVANVHFGFDFHCVITDANGKKVTTETVNVNDKNAPPVITKQPTSQVAAVGEKVTLSVVALGNGLTYQWQYKNKTATTWTNASGKTANWQLTVANVHFGFDFQCVIKDANGNKVTTETINVINKNAPPVITEQPVSKIAAVGEKVILSVVALGNGLTYQWQYKNKAATDWTNASGKTANWQLTVANVHFGFDFQCVITDANGKKVTTETVNIVNKNGPPVITEQPTSQIAAVGEKVTLSVVALGNGLNYQWQYKSKTATTWTNASGKTANWQLTVAKVHFGFDFQCVITDANGKKATTETVHIDDKNGPPVITEQPMSQTAEVGDKVTLSVVAIGNGLTYQWQYKNKTATTWTNASGKTANWVLTVAKVHFGFDFQCVITDENGNVVTTDTVNINSKYIVIDNVTYEPITETTCRILSYDGTAASVTIPEIVENMTVTEIAPDAFAGKTTLTSITLPNTITVIGARAFKGCTSLSQMNTH